MIQQSLARYWPKGDVTPENWRRDDERPPGRRVPTEYAHQAITAAAALPTDDGLSYCVAQPTGAGQEDTCKADADPRNAVQYRWPHLPSFLEHVLGTEGR
jgi:hypothetical protein